MIPEGIFDIHIKMKTTRHDTVRQKKGEQEGGKKKERGRKAQITTSEVSTDITT